MGLVDWRHGQIGGDGSIGYYYSADKWDIASEDDLKLHPVGNLLVLNSEEMV